MLRSVLAFAVGALALCAAVLFARASSEPAWDVANTGQPETTVEFTATKGTWMSVTVSPDGTTLAFDLLGDIYTLPATGGTATLIHGGPAMQRTPRFSPDGRKLLFISDTDGSDNLWQSNIDGSEPRQITHQTTEVVTSPAWGHDGTYAVASKHFGTADKLNASEIRSFRVADGKGSLLVPTPSNGLNVHEAQVSPDGRYLYHTERVTGLHVSHVYVDASHGNFAIKRRDLKTSDSEELIRGFGGATTPMLSPDGKRLAFIRRVKEKTVLFVYDIATRAQQPVYDGLDRDAQGEWIMQGTYYPQYDWFPDNRHIAIWGKGKLLNVDTDTGTARELPFKAQVRQRVVTPVRVAQDLAPKRFTVRAIRQLAVSPDGRHVAFNALGHVWTKALPEGEPKRLTQAKAFEFEPTYAPDGRHIAYVEWDDEKGSSLIVAAANGSTRTVVTAIPGVIRSPSFSPDGKRLVYQIANGDKCLGGFRGTPGLYVASVEGGESRRVGLGGDAPHFSPDGKHLIYAVTEYAGENILHKLMSVAVDGKGARELARAESADILELKPSPDLRSLAFRAYQQYYVMPLGATRAPVKVTPPTARKLTNDGGYELAWSADSSRLHWLLGDQLQGTSISPGAQATNVPVGLETTSDVPEGSIAFTGARIVTMRGEEVIERGTIVVIGNRIAAIGSNVAIPKGAKVIDASGKTIMPGLVDMHGHIDNCYYSSTGLMPLKAPSRYADLAFGVTTNYDPYTSELPTYSIAEMTRAGVMVGPRSINSGAVVHGREGRGDAVYIPIATLDHARHVMARKRALGGTIIKSYRQPMRRQRQQLIKAGREAGIMADVEGESHLYGNISMILDGHTAIEHNFPVATYYDDIIRLMGGAKTAHTPTLIITFGEILGENYIYQTTRAWEDPKLRTFVQETTSGYSPLGTPYGAPPHVRGMTTIHVADELWDIGFRSVARSMKKLDDVGAIVNVGSHGQVSGLAQHWEMWLLAEGGMSKHRVLRAATLNGARTLALDKQIGSLEEGKLADLIVLDRDPLQDIRNTNTVRWTMVNGRLYDSLTMNEAGNRERPRGKFYWELPDYRGIDWNDAWSAQ